MTKPTAAIGHMPFPGHMTCAEWVRETDLRFYVRISGLKPVAPRNTKFIPRYSHYGMEK